MTGIEPPPPPGSTPPPPPAGAVPPPPPPGMPVNPYATAPAPGTRSTGKFVTGIVLTALGGLCLLVAIPRILVALGGIADNPGYALGSFVGSLLIPAVLLVVGIVLLLTSKRR